MAKMMIQIANFLTEKGQNVFHPEKELVQQGYFTGVQRANIIHLKAHGFVAKHKEPGNWVMTKKGSRFLKGEEIPKTAIRSKRPPRHTIGYLEHMCTIKDVLKSNDHYWAGFDYEVFNGRVVTQDIEQL